MCYAPALVGGGFGPSGGHLQCDAGAGLRSAPRASRGGLAAGSQASGSSRCVELAFVAFCLAQGKPLFCLGGSNLNFGACYLGCLAVSSL